MALNQVERNKLIEVFGNSIGLRIESLLNEIDDGTASVEDLAVDDDLTVGGDAAVTGALTAGTANIGGGSLTVSGVAIAMDLETTLSAPLNLNSGLTIGDGNNIAVNTTTGTKIGTATGQKLGFYNATPVVQRAALTAADGATVDGTYGAQEQGVIENIRTRVGEIEAALETLGLIATN